MKTAFIIIDLQEGFFRTGPLLDRRSTLTSNVNELIKICRTAGIPIIWITQTYKEDLSDAPLYNKRTGKNNTMEGTSDTNILHELDIQEEDAKIIKKRFSVFFKTDLLENLKNNQIERLIIAGINTMTCVRTSVIDAYQLDYPVILATDCVDGYDKEQHETSLKYMSYATAELKSNREIEELLK